MICPNCKKPVNQLDKFCPNCGQPLTRTRAQQEKTQKRRSTTFNDTVDQKESNNELLEYLKNNIVLTIVEIILAVALIYWKYPIGLVVTALMLIAYYIRATTNKGQQEKLDIRLRNISKKRINFKSNKIQPVQKNSKISIFNKSSNLIGILVGIGITLITDFFGVFIKLHSVEYNTSTNLSLYDAFKMNGVTNSLMNTFNIQFNIQPFMLIVFYLMLIIPLIIFVLTFIGGRFVRTLLSLILFGSYLGMFIFINIETTTLNQNGLSLGITPGIMMYVAIFSTFIMTVYSAKLKKNKREY